MAISFGGEFRVARTPEETYDFLTDAQRFARLLPDFESLTLQDPTHFTVQLKVGISHIRGSAVVHMRLTEGERPRRAQYRGKGTVAGGNIEMAAGFDLAPAEKGALVRWKGEAQIFGRLMSVAGGLLDPLARKNVQKLIDGLQAALGSKEETV